MHKQSSFQIEALEPRQMLTAALVADLSPIGLQPRLPTPFGDKLLFTGSTPSTGRELWVSDGTAAGTKMLKNIAPDLNDAFITEIVPVGAEAFFNTSFTPGSVALWRTDGTRKGTIVVKTFDSNIGATELTELDGLLYFSGPGGLWRSDGTGAGTFEVKDFADSFGNSGAPMHIARGGDFIYLYLQPISSDLNLWRSDGTANGTEPIFYMDWLPFMVSVNNEFFAFGNIGDGNDALWTTDQNNELIKLQGMEELVGFLDVNETTWVSGVFGGDRFIWKLNGDTLEIMGTGTSNLDFLGLVNGKVLYSEQSQIKTIDINDASNQSLLDLGDEDSLGISVAVGQQIYFERYHSDGRRELWATDGANAHKITQVPRGFAEGAGLLSPVGSNLFFEARDASEQSELWISDGTSTGTHMVLDLKGSPESSGVGQLLPIGNDLYFITPLPPGSDEDELENLYTIGLWKTDANAAIPVVTNRIKGRYRVGDTRVWQLGSRILLACNSNSYYYSDLWDLWLANPATGAVKKVASDFHQPKYFASVGNRVLFLNKPDFGSYQYAELYAELWSTDGSKSGTIRLRKRPNGDYVGGEYYSNPALFRGRVYFEEGVFATNSLWTTDGTRAGTHTASDWFNGALFKPTAYGPMAVHGKSLYFSAFDKLQGWSLWRTQATSNTTLRLKSFSKDGASAPTMLTSASEFLYFNAGTGGETLFRTDGTLSGTVAIGHVPLEPQYSRTWTVGNSYYVNAVTYDGIGGQIHRLYTSNGTTKGTEQVNIQSFSDQYVVWNKYLAFISGDPYRGELWRLEGQKTKVLDPLNNVSFGETELVVVGDRIFFLASDEKHGQELWSWIK